MIDVIKEKSLALTAQERYDIISFAMDAADDNGFINSFIFERALYCYTAIMLYQEQKEILSEAIAIDLIRAWEILVENGFLEKMIVDYADVLEVLSEEATQWYKEYSDWAHSARGVLEMVEQFSGDIVGNAANMLRNTAQETKIDEVLDIANEWGMNRELLKENTDKTVETAEDSLFN